MGCGMGLGRGDELMERETKPELKSNEHISVGNNTVSGSTHRILFSCLDSTPTPININTNGVNGGAHHTINRQRAQRSQLVLSLLPHIARESSMPKFQAGMDARAPRA